MTQRALSLPRRRPSALLRLLPSGRALLVATALVLIAAGLYGLARGTSMFAVRTVEVQGASPALAAQVRAALRPVEGTNLLALKAGAIVPPVEELPAVRSASYDRDFPHTLRVRVVPEKVGTFDFHCDVFCGSGHEEMAGRIMVSAPVASGGNSGH